MTEARPRPRRFDLVVFDWDGTLFDSTGLITRCIQLACDDLGVRAPSDRDAAYVIGLGLAEALRHAVPDLPVQRYPELGRRYREHYMARQHELSLFPGTLAMLRHLRARHHWLAVATGKSRRGLDDALRHADLRGVFDGSRTADETASKPDPRMLHELMREFGTDPQRTLMIGDTTHDLQMATNAEVPAVAVAFGAHGREQLDGFAPLHVAADTHDLLQWLDAHA